jgi:hypothetical protein
LQSMSSAFLQSMSDTLKTSWIQLVA